MGNPVVGSRTFHEIRASAGAAAVCGVLEFPCTIRILNPGTFVFTDPGGAASDGGMVWAEASCRPARTARPASMDFRVIACFISRFGLGGVWSLARVCGTGLNSGEKVPGFTRIVEENRLALQKERSKGDSPQEPRAHRFPL